MLGNTQWLGFNKCHSIWPPALSSNNCRRPRKEARDSWIFFIVTCSAVSDILIFRSSIGSGGPGPYTIRLIFPQYPKSTGESDEKPTDNSIIGKVFVKNSCTILLKYCSWEFSVSFQVRNNVMLQHRQVSTIINSGMMILPEKPNHTHNVGELNGFSMNRWG